MKKPSGITPFLSAILLSSFAARPVISEEIVDQVLLNGQPTAIGMDTTLDRIYLPGFSVETGERVLGMYNLRDGSQSAIPLSLFETPIGVAINSQTGRVYVRTDFSQILVIDGYARTLVKSVPVDVQFFFGTGTNFPDSIAINEDTGRVFTIGFHVSSGRQLVGYDDDGDVITRTPLGEFDPYTIAVNSTTGRVYVAGYAFTGDRLLLVFDSDGLLLDTVPVNALGGGLAYLAVNKTTNQIYLAGYKETGDRVIVVFDGNDLSFSLAPLGDFYPLDVAVSTSSGRVFVPGNDIFGQTSIQVLDGQGTFLNSVPLERIDTVGAVVDPENHRVFHAGNNDFGERVLTVLQTPVCSSDATTIGTLRNEVTSLTTSNDTIQVLLSTLDNVQQALNNGNNATARSRLSTFVDRLVNRSNYSSTNPDRILLTEANQLLCGAANVLIGVPLP